MNGIDNCVLRVQTEKSIKSRMSFLWGEVFEAGKSDRQKVMTNEPSKDAEQKQMGQNNWSEKLNSLLNDEPMRHSCVDQQGRQEMKDKSRADRNRWN